MRLSEFITENERMREALGLEAVEKDKINKKYVQELMYEVGEWSRENPIETNILKIKNIRIFTRIIILASYSI